jgi:flagellar motor switch protein FliG
LQHIHFAFCPAVFADLLYVRVFHNDNRTNNADLRTLTVNDLQTGEHTTKMIVRKLFLAATSAMLFFSAVAHSQIDRVQMVQADVEKVIKSIIGSQLQESEYFVFAKVKLNQEGANTAGADKFANLPYSPIKVEKDYLEDMFRRNLGQYPKLEELRVTIVFDQRVPQEKVDLLSGVIRDRFEFNDSNRTLEIRSLALVSEPVRQAEKLVLEKTKLDSERALLELQSQREKFEMQKREEDLRKKIAEIESAKVGADTKSPDAPVQAEAATPSTSKPTKSVLDYLESFQLLILAFVAAIVIIAMTILGGGIVRKGIQPMAEAIGKIGDGVGNMAPAPVAVAAGPVASGGPAGGRSEAGSPEGLPAVAGQVIQAEDKSFEEFLEGVSEKLRIMIDEKNFSFYRHFCDMIDSATHRKMAAAIMLAVDEASVVELLKGVSGEHIELLKDQLARPGGVAEAQSLKKAALQEFFGRIAAEEFSGSPLSRMKNMTWITSMNADQMSAFVLSLDEKLRAALISCLTPSRVNAILAVATSQDDKKQILTALRMIESISDKDIEAAMVQIAEVFEKQKQAMGQQGKKGVDVAKYMAKLAETMTPEEKNLLMQEIQTDTELTKRIREHIIPFDALVLLPKELVSEIFLSRSDLQIAQILFSADDRVRAAVLLVLPEIRRENVTSELSLLESNKVYAKRYQKTSLQLQTEICKYLLVLYKEGVIDFEAQAGELREVEVPANGTKNVA